MIAVIDVQAFCTPEFTAKELSVWDGSRLSHYLFKPPFPFRCLNEDLRRQAIWLERNHHGLRWTRGFADLKDLPEILLHDTAHVHTVYCKGLEKGQYIQKFLGSKVNILEDYDFKLEPSRPACLNHILDICHCTINNCKYLYDEIIQS